MTENPNHEERISALEQQGERLPAIEERLAQVGLDAAAARHLAAAVDRDVADLTLRVSAIGGKVDALDGKVDALDGKVDALDGKVDANRAAINALGEQTAGGFAQVRGRLDGLAAGQDVIQTMLASLLDKGGDPPA